MFELSAFLKAQQGRVGDKLPNVQIKPLLLGLVAGSVVVSGIDMVVSMHRGFPT